MLTVLSGDLVVTTVLSHLISQLFNISALLRLVCKCMKCSQNQHKQKA